MFRAMMEQLDLLDLLNRLDRPSVEALLTPDQIYESDDYALFCRLVEDARFDRKSSRIQPNGLAPCFSAFANGPSVEGGVVAIGISDKAKIEGCKQFSPERLQAIESVQIQYCPTAKVKCRRVAAVNQNGENDFIILFRVYYVPDRLVELTNGDAYQRVGDKSVNLNDQRKYEIRIDKGERSFEQEACQFNYPDDFSGSDIRKFCNKIRERRESAENHEDEAILEALRLGRRVHQKFFPNNACALLFAKDPGRVFPGAYVRFLRYLGIEEQSGQKFNVIKDRVIEGSIRTVIQEAAQVIDANIREFTEFRNGKFHSVQEYPRDAWYELLVNACVHRSYTIRNVPIFIKLFEDRIVFESPGGFMPGVTPENIYDRHHPRNPFIMSVLRETGEVRCINEGTKRVRREMEDAKLPAPLFVEKKGDAAAVSVTLNNNIKDRSNSLDSEAYTALGEAIAFSLTVDERKIINYVIAHNQINVSDALRILTSTRWHTAKKRLDGLVERGILEFHSSKLRDPFASYTLTRPPNNR